MNWLDRAETRLGHLAIPGLPRIIVGFNLLVFILYKGSPAFLHFLELNRAAVLRGEVWRLVSFAFIPQFGSIIDDWLTVLLYLLYLFFIGTGLEQAMGAFKLNVYYLLGLAGVAAASMMFGSAYAPGMLNATLFFAFARYYPETIIYLMYILPVKVKWLAWLATGLLLILFTNKGWDFRASLLVCLLNYIVFFGVEHYREVRQRREVNTRRQRFEADTQAAGAVTLHECAVCGVTEASDPYMDFRVARDGKEYCSAHLPKAAAPSA